MNYALRKSTGPFAAGTRVKLINDNNSDGTVTVEVQCEPNETFFVDELVFDIEPHMIVELRNRTYAVPALNRKDRRQFTNKLFNNVK